MRHQHLQLQLSPDQASGEALEGIIKAKLGWDLISGYEILKRSIDARGRRVKYQLSVLVWQGDAPERDAVAEPQAKQTDAAPEVHVVGAGPAGYFAALRLLELGFKPIVLERGKPVRERRRDLVQITRHGQVNEESNYCFGEGGAGTYSDGKLYTRSGKRGSIKQVLDWLIYFGAPTDIRVDARPHIGTNKLPGLLTEMRAYIEAHGGEVRFETKVTGFERQGNRIKALLVNGRERLPVSQTMLLTGHSARDIFRLLVESGIEVQNKAFAMGVRIEHPQEHIDQMQYHGCQKEYALPPAYYSLQTQVKQLGVYSFCMCPGGIIAPCSTEQNAVVTNGWSPSKRNNPFANSGLVSEVPLSETAGIKTKDGLHALAFQERAEQEASLAGGGMQVAPAQRLGDFLARRSSNAIGPCSYRPGVQPSNLHQVLPKPIAERLWQAFKHWEKHLPTFAHKEAVLVGVESRTSSPVRIPRDPITLNHPQIENLYPGGEGAGYAGGIVSAAMDGIRLAEALAKKEPNKVS